MKIEFIGAAGTVTGSKFLLTAGRKNILVDCGLYQGQKNLRQQNWKALPVHAPRIDSVILTHAHIDHSGYIPLLVKQGFTGDIFCSKSTKALCQVLLPDSGHIQEEDASFANKHKFSKHNPALPLYTEQDARKALHFFRSVRWGEPFALSGELTVSFHRAGHIIGASIVRLEGHGTTITFSGDLGRSHSETMKPPSEIQETEYLVMESTYGNRLHPDINAMESVKDIITKTAARGGIVLIPAFAVGRVQQILYIIHQLKKVNKIPNLPVYLDSPMAVEATHLFCEFSEDHAIPEKECREMMGTAHFVASSDESKRLNNINEPCVIISASGMAEGGRVLHHLKRLAPHAKNTLHITGFQAPGKRGHAIVNHAKEVKIHGIQIPIHAEVINLESLSAHADQNEILDFLKHFHRPPKKTFLVHGEPDASMALKKKIEDDLGWDVLIPAQNDSFEL